MPSRKRKTSKRSIKPNTTHKVKYASSSAPLLRLPLDLYVELASHLSILDFLQLSRCCKTLYNIFLSKTFRPIWCGALRELGAPECPSDISEPQYVELVFGSTCYECGTPSEECIDFGYRVRICEPCHALKMVQGKDLIERENRPGNETRKILTMCYHQRLGKTDLSERSFYAPEFERISLKYRSLQTKSSKKKFMQRRKKLIDEIHVHAQSVDKWIDTLEGAGLGSTEGTILKRHLCSISIQNTLRSLGHSEDEITTWRKQPEWQELIEDSYPITSRMWPDIYDNVKKVAEAAHESKLARLWNDAYDVYLTWLGTIDRPVFTYTETKLLPEVQSIIELADSRKAESLALTERQTIRNALSVANDALVIRVKDDCLEALLCARRSVDFPFPAISHGVGHNDSVDRALNHATSFFLAKSDRILPPFSRLGFHERFFRFGYHAVPWKPPILCPKVINVACALLRDLDLPNDSTIGILDEGYIFTCERCDQNPAELMRWTNLVEHFYREMVWYERMSEYLASHPSSKKVPIIDSHNVTQPGRLAKMEAPRYFRYGNREFICSMCEEATAPLHPEGLAMEGTRAGILAHIRVR